MMNGREPSSALSDDASTELIGIDARVAIESAAQRLQMDPLKLAACCADGELAEAVIELRLARHTLPQADRDRVESLLRRIGALP